MIIDLFDKKYYSLTVIYFLESSLLHNANMHIPADTPVITVSVVLRKLFIDDLLKKNVKDIITLPEEIFHNIRKFF